VTAFDAMFGATFSLQCARRFLERQCMPYSKTAESARINLSMDISGLATGTTSQVQREPQTRESSMHQIVDGTRKSRTILFVTNAFSYGGTEKHLLDLLKRIRERNVRSIVLCTDSDPFTERLADECRGNVIVRSEKSLKSMKDWRRLFREIRPNVVVLVYGTLWILPWFVAVAARLEGIRKLYAIHQLMPQPPAEKPVMRIRSARDFLRKIFGKRVRKLLSARVPPYLCRKTICVSDAVRKSLTQDYGFPSRRLVTIYNGVSLDCYPPPSDRTALRAKLGIGADEFVLVCTARLSPEKGIDLLVSAIGKVIQAGLACKCIVIGEGALKKSLSEQSKALGLSRNVFFEGFRADVRPYLSAADVFVLTSHIEGLPFSVLEAMASGLPCVVTNVGGNAEAVHHNVNGLIIKPGSAEEAATAIIQLMTHPDECRRMAQASLSRAGNEFDLEAKMADIKRLILI
jgi:glycosyltransferase involved in cell wall biosynthesis